MWDESGGWGGSGGGMEMWIDWFEQGYQPWLHCRGFLKMTPGDGITSSLCRAGAAFYSVNGGRNSRERQEGKVPISEILAGKVTGGFFTCNDFNHLVLLEWMTNDWSKDWLLTSFYPPSPSSPIFLALAACIYDKANWQLNLIEFSRQWLWRHFLHSVWVI